MSIDWNKRSSVERVTTVPDLHGAPALPGDYTSVSRGTSPLGPWDAGLTQYIIVAEYKYFLNFNLGTHFTFQGHLYRLKEVSNKLTLEATGSTLTLVRVDPP